LRAFTSSPVRETERAAESAAALSRSSTVEYAEPNLELKALGVPNDARFGELYGLQNANDADMDAPEGWDLIGYPTIPATTVGIVDTGIDAAHEDLAGVDVLSTKRGGGYVAFSGTSMATPHVAGVAALIAAKNPTFSATQIRAKLDTSVDDKGAPGRDPEFGFGRVNLVRALS
jgi:thermitase